MNSRALIASLVHRYDIRCGNFCYLLAIASVYTMHLPRRQYHVRVRVGHQRDGQFSLLTSAAVNKEWMLNTVLFRDKRLQSTILCCMAT